MKPIVVGFALGPIELIRLFLTLVVVAVSATLIIYFVKREREKDIKYQMHHLPLNPNKTTE